MQQTQRINCSSFLPRRPIEQHRLLFPPSHLIAGGRRRQQHKRSVCFSSTSPWLPSSSSSRLPLESKCSLSPLEAVLFDIDGTLCDSDPIHFFAFRELLMGIGFLAGTPISEQFYSERISGRHNDDIARSLFPEWDEKQTIDFVDKKEALFRRLAPGKLQAVEGLRKLCSWVEDRGVKRAAVSNAPRANADLMISLLGLTDFFQVVVVADDCDRAKPFPDPYLKALERLRVSPEQALAFEDSPSGVIAGAAAGIAVVGLTTRNPRQQLEDAGAALLIENFEDPGLWKMLQGLVVS